MFSAVNLMNWTWKWLRQNSCLRLYLRGGVSAGAILWSLETAACLTVCHKDKTLARKMPFRTRKPPRSLVSLQLSISTALLRRPGNNAEQVNPQLTAKAKISRNLPLLLGVKVPQERCKLHIDAMHTLYAPNAASIGWSAIGWVRARVRLHGWLKPTRDPLLSAGTIRDPSFRWCHQSLRSVVSWTTCLI